MSPFEKFLPEIPPLDAPFWESVKTREIKLQRCDACAAFRFIPFEICRHCHSDSYTWTAIRGHGSVYTYTVIYRAPTPAYQREVPYVIVHVELAEGPRMIGNLVGCEIGDVEIGMPVVIDYEDVTEEVTLYRFRPA